MKKHMPISRRHLLLAALAPLPQGIRRFKDDKTGREVWQITNDDGFNHSCYFEAQPFTADDRYLVYASRRTGAMQLYRADLTTGEHAQITNGKDIHSMSYSIYPDGRTVIFQEGTRLVRAEVATGQVTWALDMASLRIPGAQKFSAGRTYSTDGRYTAVSYQGDKAGIALIDLGHGKLHGALDNPSGTGGHLLICPGDPLLVTFVKQPDEQNQMDLAPERRARTMLANFRTGQIRPFLTMPTGFRATHEYWDAQGVRFYFHKKSVPGWVPTSICSVRRNGTGEQTHFTHDTLKLGHSMISRDNRFIVSDVQEPGSNPLVYIDLRFGTHKILCWPDSTVREGHAQQAHVHPSISASGKLVAYTSNQGGNPQVYVVPL